MDFDEDDTIVNPRQYEDKPEWGIVVGIGENVERFKEGDVVCFGQYSSITVRSHGVDLFFVKSDEIMSKYSVA